VEFGLGRAAMRGSRGIGRATALRLVAEGCIVAIFDLDEAD